MLLFIGSSALSVVAMALATGNYLQFFPAMEKITVRITSAEVRPTDNGNDIEMVFVVENPTGYSGIGVRAFQASLTFKYPNGTKTAYGAPPTPPRSISSLPPYSILNFPWRAPMRSDTWGGIAEEFRDGKVSAAFRVLVNLSTFLDNMSWIIISYQCTVEQSPVDCTRGQAMAVSPVTAGGL